MCPHGDAAEEWPDGRDSGAESSRVMDVGVRELKQHLSEYLDRARRGEVIRVTDRGVPKAVLGPLPGRLRIEDGIAEGWIRPARGAPRPSSEITPVRLDRPSAEIIDEGREDRF